MGVRVPPPTQTPTNKRRLSRRISGSDFSAIGAGPSAHRFHGHIWPLNREDAVLILPSMVHKLTGHIPSMEWPFCRRYAAKYSSGLGILLLVFSLWWLYFDRTAQRMLRSLGTTIIWGYGHYFIFASAAAIGAGLSVAVDALGSHAHFTHLQQGLAVGVPLAVWIVAVWWLHVGPLLRGPVVAASPLAAVLVPAAAWTPAAVPVMAGITAALAVVTTWAMRRADWPIPDTPNPNNGAPRSCENSNLQRERRPDLRAARTFVTWETRAPEGATGPRPAAPRQHHRPPARRPARRRSSARRTRRWHAHGGPGDGHRPTHPHGLATGRRGSSCHSMRCLP
jgi:hypothetical protein